MHRRRRHTDGDTNTHERTGTLTRTSLPQDEEDPIETTFELNETLHAKAKIPPTEEVYIWLGANVMLSYPIEEAEQLLDSKLKAATTSLQNCEEDLDFLREQITVRSTDTLPMIRTGGERRDKRIGTMGLYTRS